jgi:hypothetical protein
MEARRKAAGASRRERSRPRRRLNPSSSRFASTSSPGCGVLQHSSSPSVAVDQVNVARSAVGKAENDPPIGTHGDRPKASELALERMQPRAARIKRMLAGGLESFPAGGAALPTG